MAQTEKTYFLKLQEGQNYSRAVPRSVHPSGFLRWSASVPVCPTPIPRSLALELLKEQVPQYAADGSPRGMVQRFAPTTAPVVDATPAPEDEALAAQLDAHDLMHDGDEDDAPATDSTATSGAGGTSAPVDLASAGATTVVAPPARGRKAAAAPTGDVASGT